MKVFPVKYVNDRIEIALSDDTKYGEVEEYLLGELFKRNWTIFVPQRYQALRGVGAGRETVLLIFQHSHFIVYLL